MSDERSLVVTGGASGLGRGIAIAAVAAGYRVAILDTAVLDDAASALGIAGFQGSICDEADVSSLMDAFGTPSVWVNNAGIVRFGQLADLAVDDFRQVVEVNLVGTFSCSQQVARAMAAQGGGSIVNITSMNGVAPGPGSGAYGATKAGLTLLTQQMAIEWAPMGVRVNAVAPGLINDGMSLPIYADQATRQARESKVPAGRLGTADDVAAAVLFLAGDQAAYITGQNLLVDGGVTMSMIANLPRPAAVYEPDQQDAGATETGSE